MKAKRKKFLKLRKKKMSHKMKIERSKELKRDMFFVILIMF